MKKINKQKLPSIKNLGIVAGVIILTVIGARLFFASHASQLPGDANSDGVVNISDLAILAAHYGLTGGATWAEGDFNGDGNVNVADLSILASHWGETLSDLPAVPSNLSATATSSSTVNLTWTADSSSGGTVTYYIYRGGTEITTTTATSYGDSGLTGGDSYNYTIAANNSYGTSDQSATVGVTTPTGAVSFPSVLHTSAGHLVDANGHVLPRMKGFDIQADRNLSQANYDTIKTEGSCTSSNPCFQRMVTFWADYQGSNCSAMTGSMSSLDNSIAYAANDDIYTEIMLYYSGAANSSNGTPSCASTGGSQSTRYQNGGQYITQYLANRYGNPSSPEYTKSVVGFGINEPDAPDGTNSATVNTALETMQSTMIGWFRDSSGQGTGAPDWIGFVNYVYAQSSPLMTSGDTSGSCSSCANANPNAFSSVGGNVILEVHEYFTDCASGSNASTCDGRQWFGNGYDGQMYSSSNGGPALGPDDPSNPAYPTSGVTRAQAQQEQLNFIHPYGLFAGYNGSSGWPLMVGEWGWAPSTTSGGVNTTGGTNYIDDMTAAWNNAGAAIELQWDYDNGACGGDPWCAAPGGTWQTVTNEFFTDQ